MKPFCVILTHRHGACICLALKKPMFIKSNFQETLQNYIVQKKSILQKYENFEFFYEKDSFVCARVLGKTAENLSNLFQFSRTIINYENIATIQNIIVGTGPGSFTGLRLGCAFANGLNLGCNSSVKLFSVSTPFLNHLYTDNSNHNVNAVFFDELGNYQPHDPSSGYVTFFDLFYAIHQINENKIVPCHTLIPNYGRAPTPVLNLGKE